MNFNYIEGQTPIDDDELTELKLSHISTLDELNIWELQNIQSATQWATSQKQDILKEPFIRKLHEKMFCDVWYWAGKYRKTNKNLGIDKHSISVEVKKLLDDAKLWISASTYKKFELAARFHHRLVSIHPFPNGNGRHARLMTDILVSNHLDQKRLNWGKNQNLTKKGTTRSRYIGALREADKGNFTPLIDFVQ